ncbi:MAG: DNA repair protein RadC [Balneolaceae bacterium]
MNQESLESRQISNRTVKEMQPDEQPREKFIRYGSESLSNAELFAILLRTGSSGMNVLDTAKILLESSGGLRSLVRKDWRDLKRIPGIGNVKAITLESVFELARRIQITSLGDQIQIQNPEDAVAYFSPKLRDLTKEVFLVAYLNNSKTLTGFTRISVGGATATIVDPSEVFHQAILNDACSILLLHNHPSGNVRESKADIHLTDRLVKSGKLLGIPVDDHIIIAGDGFNSLRSKGHI